MSQPPFVIELDSLFRQHSHDLRVDALTDRDAAWELLLSSDSASAVQVLLGASRQPELTVHLGSWSDGDLFVSVKGPGWREAVPTLLIRDGRLFLVSGAQAQAERAAPVPEFAEWFERLVGAPPPFSLELQPLERGIWGSANTAGREVSGFPHRLRIKGLDGYTVAGYAGHGVNSYAFYFTRAEGDTTMALRLPWGGAYMDPDEYRPRLLSELEEANDLFERAVEKRLPLRIRSNMGDWSFATRASEDPSKRRDLLNFEEVRRFVETAQRR